MNGLYGGAYLHADDIRTLATSVSSLNAHIAEVLSFAASRFLQLKPSASATASSTLSVMWRERFFLQVVPPSALDIYGIMTYLLIHQLSATFRWLGSLFQFRADLSPLSSRSVVETCILPVFVYGAKNW